MVIRAWASEGMSVANYRFGGTERQHANIRLPIQAQIAVSQFDHCWFEAAAAG
jgi:hypothetical protein